MELGVHAEAAWCLISTIATIGSWPVVAFLGRPLPMASPARQMNRSSVRGRLYVARYARRFQRCMDCGPRLNGVANDVDLRNYSVKLFGQFVVRL